MEKAPVNQVYIWIWSFWMTFTILQWMKKNSKISQFEDFFQGPGMRFWLKFDDDYFNSVPIINKKLVNQVYIRIWSSWLTFTVLQWMKTNSKISQFSRFLLRSEYTIHFKLWKCLKPLNSVIFIKKTLVNQVYIRIWSFWQTFTALQLIKTNSKISQFSTFRLRSGYAIQVKSLKWLKLLNSFPFIKKTFVKDLYI